MIRGIELYKEYLARIDAIKNKAGEALKEKEETNQRDILYLQDKKGKISSIKIIIMLLLMVLAAPYFIVIGSYKLEFLLYYILFALLVYLGFTFYEIYLKKEIIKLRDEVDFARNDEIKTELDKENQKIYEITLTIICLNEFYYDLKVTPKEELKNKWQKITIFKRKGIEKLMNNVVTCDKYQNYLEEWIANEEKRCKN